MAEDAARSRARVTFLKTDGGWLVLHLRSFFNSLVIDHESMCAARYTVDGAVLWMCVEGAGPGQSVTTSYARFLQCVTTPPCST